MRREVEFEHGGNRASGLNWYLAGNLFSEDGWRDDSPSDVRQIFGKVGLAPPGERPRRSRWRLPTTRSTGNGLQEQRFLDRDYASVYTKPDVTDNRATFLNVAARRRASDRVAVSANAYYRDIRADDAQRRHQRRLARSGRVSTERRRTRGARRGRLHRRPGERGERQQYAVPVLALHRQRPAERRARREVQRPDQPDADRPAQRRRIGTVDAGTTRSHGRNNQFTVGAAYDRSSVGFVQSTELGYLNADRSVTGVGAFGDGVTGGEVDGEPFDTRVDLDGVIQTWSLFATDTLSLNGSVAPHGLGPVQPDDDQQQRSDRARRRSRLARRRPCLRPVESGCGRHVQPVEVRERLRRLQRGQPRAHVDRARVRRSRGAVQASQRHGRAIHRSSRSSPGPWRPACGGSRRASAGTPALFRAENNDDILFVMSDQTGFGYFRNFGETRRQGVELGMHARIGRCHRRRRLHVPRARRTRARKRSTARATAATTRRRRESRASRDRSRSSRATGFR